MAKVTYRGVQYDTETRQKETQQSQKQLVYRGVAVKGAQQDDCSLRNLTRKRSFLGTHLRRSTTVIQL